MRQVRNLVMLSTYLGAGETPRRSGGTDSVIAIYQAFETADLPITLGLGSDAIWKRFWEVVGEPGYGQRAEFSSNAERRKHRSQIVACIQEVLAGRSRSEWLELFASARVPAGPINRVDEVARDAALQDRGMFYAVKAADGRVVPQIGLGIHVDGRPSMPRSAPPLLGEHTVEILDRLADPDPQVATG